jgi:hypothetical protein
MEWRFVMGLKTGLAHEGSVTAVTLESLAVEADWRVLLFLLRGSTTNGEEVVWVEILDELKQMLDVQPVGNLTASALKVVHNSRRSGEAFKAERALMVMGAVHIGRQMLYEVSMSHDIKKKFVLTYHFQVERGVKVFSALLAGPKPVIAFIHVCLNILLAIEHTNAALAFDLRKFMSQGGHVLFAWSAIAESLLASIATESHG